MIQFLWMFAVTYPSISCDNGCNIPGMVGLILQLPVQCQGLAGLQTNLSS